MPATLSVVRSPRINSAQPMPIPVLPDASVTSFVDHWGRSGGTGQFGGTFAPFEKLILDSDAARLASR